MPSLMLRSLEHPNVNRHGAKSAKRTVPTLSTRSRFQRLQRNFQNSASRISPFIGPPRLLLVESISAFAEGFLFLTNGEAYINCTTIVDSSPGVVIRKK
jgi:hypothetical protein